MGSALYRFRVSAGKLAGLKSMAKPSTVEMLEGIEKKISRLKESLERNQLRERIWLARLLLYSCTFYVMTCMLLYSCYRPKEWTTWLLLACVLMLIPSLIWLAQRLLKTWFIKRARKSYEALELLKKQKKNLLEEVMETESYKMAKSILERFDPDLTHIKRRERTAEFEEKVKPPPEAGTELHQRSLASRSLCGSVSQPKLPPPRESSTRFPALPHATSNTAPVSRADFYPPGPPCPRLTALRSQGWIIKMLEYLIGVGFRNRSALICHHCCCHNGMALREEFEYIAFRCAYCFALNAAKKTRCRGYQPTAVSRRTPQPSSPDLGPRLEAKAQEMAGQSDNTSAVRVPGCEVQEEGITREGGTSDFSSEDG